MTQKMRARARGELICRHICALLFDAAAYCRLMLDAISPRRLSPPRFSPMLIIDCFDFSFDFFFSIFTRCLLFRCFSPAMMPDAPPPFYAAIFHAAISSRRLSLPFIAATPPLLLAAFAADAFHSPAPFSRFLPLPDFHFRFLSVFRRYHRFDFHALPPPLCAVIRLPPTLFRLTPRCHCLFAAIITLRWLPLPFSTLRAFAIFSAIFVFSSFACRYDA
jgi:hypothetical protein